MSRRAFVALAVSLLANGCAGPLPDAGTDVVARDVRSAKELTS